MREIMGRLIILGLMFSLGVVANQQESAKKDRTGKRLEKIREYVGQAGNLYKDKEYQLSGNKINAAQTLLERSIKEGKEKYREALLKEHGRIAKAHELLSKQGIELSGLTPFPEDYGVKTEPEEPETETGDSSTGEGASTVSFKTSIAPILSDQCGNCHMRRSEGDFSMANFNSLMSGSPGGDSVVAGKPDESLLVQVIEDGEMPPRGSVPDKDLDLIKKWITEGAEFDGDDKKASLAGNRRGGRRGR